MKFLWARKKIVSVNDGSAREEVKTKAAEAAVKILKENGASVTGLDHARRLHRLC